MKAKWLSTILTALTVGGGLGVAPAWAGQAPPVVTAATVTPAVTSPQIVIKKFQFSEPTLTIAAGTTVDWINQDDDAHTVTADDGRFASAGLDQGEKFSYRFTTPGTYAYHCALHPHMTARIIVR
jgi:plastocyanin